MAKLGQLETEWDRYQALLEDGWSGVIAGTGFSGSGLQNHAERATPISEEVIDLAMRAVACRVGGMSAAEADSAAMDRLYSGKHATNVGRVAVCRKRIRDRAPWRGAAVTWRSRGSTQWASLGVAQRNLADPAATQP